MTSPRVDDGRGAEPLIKEATRFWHKMHSEGLCRDTYGAGHWAECQALADTLGILDDVLDEFEVWGKWNTGDREGSAQLRGGRTFPASRIARGGVPGTCQQL